MDLRERLRLLKSAGQTRSALILPAASAEPPPLPGAAVASPNPVPCVLGGCLQGYTRQNPYGQIFYLETFYPIEYRRGPLPLKHLFEIPGSSWELLGRVPPTVDLSTALFFDTETTGLAGGTGTYAFLAGLGFFAGSDFVVRQYFLRDYGDEEAMLQSLEEEFNRFTMLVSFNGKSFDWPLMETRFRMSRRPVPLRGVPHLDLLHPARRIFKERLSACNLTNLEVQVLGVERLEDIPGRLIPQLYFDYLRTGNAAPLAGAILHNRLDIVSLAALAGWLGHIVTSPLSPSPDGELLCGDDLFALGRLLDDRGLPATALPCLEAAVARGVSAVSNLRALRELSRLYKRLREHAQATSIWHELIQGDGGRNLYPYVELAKHYEHVTGEYHLARQMAAKALEIVQRRRSMAGQSAPGVRRDLADLQHRLRRLDRKLQA